LINFWNIFKSTFGEKNSHKFLLIITFLKNNK
jgi:hypothetical protein